MFHAWLPLCAKSAKCSGNSGNSEYSVLLTWPAAALAVSIEARLPHEFGKVKIYACFCKALKAWAYVASELAAGVLNACSARAIVSSEKPGVFIISLKRVDVESPAI